MRKINCLRYALDMATAMLKSKWIIMITHDRDNEVVMCIKTDEETRSFVDKLQEKMFKNLEEFLPSKEED